MVSPAINPAFLTGSLENWPLAQLASMGYKGLEITPACLDKLDAWKPAAESAGLKPVCVNALPDLSPYLTGSLHDGVERRRRATVGRLLSALKIMNAEHIPFLLVVPGRLAENYQTVDQARALFVSSMRELSSAAGDATILIESAPRRLFGASAELVRLIDEIARPNVAAALDIGHTLLLGENLADAVRTLGDRLRYVQLHDADLRPGFPRLDRHLPMGEGSAKREDVTAALKGRPVAVNIAAPANPLEAAHGALGWIPG